MNTEEQLANKICLHPNTAHLLSCSQLVLLRARHFTSSSLGRRKQSDESILSRGLVIPKHASSRAGMPKQQSVVVTSALLPLAGVPPPATPPAARRQRHTAGRRPLPHEWRERVGTQHRLRQLWLHLRRAILLRRQPAILLHQRMVVTLLLLLLRRGGVAPWRAVRALRGVAPLRRQLLAVLLLRRSAVLLRGRRLVLLRACGVASTSLATRCKCSCSLTHTAQAQKKHSAVAHRSHRQLCRHYDIAQTVLETANR